MNNPGYRGEDATSWQRSHREINKDVFDAGEDLANETWRMLGGVRVTAGDAGEIATAVLLLRGLEHFEALLLIGEHGYVAGARILARSILEVLFTLGAVGADEGTLRQWGRDVSREKLRRLEKLTGSSRFGSDPSVVNVNKELRATLQAEVDAMEKTRLTVEYLARKAELHDLYLVAYPLYSADTHSTALSLERNLGSNEDGVLDRIAAGPECGDIPHVLAVSGLALIECADRTAQHRGDALGNEMERLRVRFEALVGTTTPKSDEA